MDVKVGNLKFVIENKLAQKLDLFCDRMTKPRPALDSCFVNSGNEGEGKTNASLIEAAYIYLKTGRPIHLFFKTSNCQKHLQNTEKQNAVLDEPALESLSTDAMTTRSRDFLRLTSTMRSKRHSLIVNVTKFWKFPEFLIVDRSLAMIHLHSNNGQDMGRFLYIRKKNLEKLWNAYKKSGQRLYGKLKSFGGRFSYVMEELFENVPINVEGKPNCTFEDYQKLKNEAIASIGGVQSKKMSQIEMELAILKGKLSKIKVKELKTNQDLAERLGINRATLRKWSENNATQGIPLDKMALRGGRWVEISNNVVDGKENSTNPPTDDKIDLENTNLQEESDTDSQEIDEKSSNTDENSSKDDEDFDI